MKTIIDSIRLQINERLTSPLVGSFFLSWICWNHRFLFVIFSSLPVRERFEFIDHQLYPAWWETLNAGLIKPALTSILFILLYPRVSNFFLRDWLQKQVETKALRDDIEKETMLTKAESRTILMNSYKIRGEYENTIQELTQEIEILRKNAHQPRPDEMSDSDLKAIIDRDKIQKNEVERLKKLVTDLQDANSAKPSEQTIEKGTIELIKLLVSQNGEFAKDNVITEFGSRFKDNRVRAQYYIDEAVRLHLITVDWKNRGSQNFLFCSLTDQGRKFAIKQGLA